jgi:hypothetical protein
MRCGKRVLLALFPEKTIICQDRLGTNRSKAHQKRTRFVQAEVSIDNVTQGEWIGKYGSEAYALFGFDKSNHSSSDGGELLTQNLISSVFVRTAAIKRRSFTKPG